VKGQVSQGDKSRSEIQGNLFPGQQHLTPNALALPPSGLFVKPAKKTIKG